MDKNDMAALSELVNYLPPTQTPLPRRSVLILLIAHFTEPLVFSIVSPIGSSLVHGGHYQDVQGKEMYAQWVFIAYPLAQMISGVAWGALSDRVGRRSILLAGHLGSAASILLFSFSISLPQVIVTRAMCGLFHGTLGVANSSLGDLSNGSNQGQAISLLAFVSGLSVIIGSVLRDLMKRTQSLGEPDGLSHSFTGLPHPSLALCLVSLLMSLMGFLATLFYLRESLIHPGWRKAQTIHKSPPPITMEKAPMFDEVSANGSMCVSSTLDRPFPLHAWPKCKSWTPPPGHRYTLMYLGLSLLLPLIAEIFCSARTSTLPMLSDLGVGPHGMRLVFMILSMIVLVAQLPLFPRMESEYGTRIIYRTSMGLLALIYFFLPWVGMLVGSLWVWPALLLIMTAKFWGHTMSYASSSLLVLEMARRAGRLGMIHGAATSLLALTRIIAPILGSFFWNHGSSIILCSWMGSPIPWWILSLGALTVYSLVGRTRRRTAFF
ncbi:major facilitator superfamily domain-containing protein [Piptocephalis cylindrospora]|uniref:Major facilitator superfamily domain-containing protein n=1 Tax=Piptocephalis cylindrospora TaxID=1907219 RepID=A0A4P9Y7H9_9FUNG|nr:major facilitator superfamily domain-containing protein [Piptocephalis cylindrospora]|eukprot:RKP15097.1 major facilitator superfamily domain-containing protein [Piptocephalis cylindrospora]